MSTKNENKVVSINRKKGKQHIVNNDTPPQSTDIIDSKVQVELDKIVDALPLTICIEGKLDIRTEFDREKELTKLQRFLRREQPSEFEQKAYEQQCDIDAKALLYVLCAGLPGITMQKLSKYLKEFEELEPTPGVIIYEDVVKLEKLVNELKEAAQRRAVPKDNGGEEE